VYVAERRLGRPLWAPALGPLAAPGGLPPMQGACLTPFSRAAHAPGPLAVDSPPPQR